MFILKGEKSLEEMGRPILSANIILRKNNDFKSPEAPPLSTNLPNFCLLQLIVPSTCFTNHPVWFSSKWMDTKFTGSYDTNISHLTSNICDTPFWKFKRIAVLDFHHWKVWMCESKHSHLKIAFLKAWLQYSSAFFDVPFNYVFLLFVCHFLVCFYFLPFSFRFDLFVFSPIIFFHCFDNLFKYNLVDFLYCFLYYYHFCKFYHPLPNG